jgi:3-hydroxyisobutyrate dehydrogenase-like beta-hydroxyacid dehydrogenase
MEDRERVAFLGLGIMGAPMAANLARAGFDLTVWNRTIARAEEFAAEHEGSRMAETPAEAAAQATVAISMVPDGPEVEAVLLGDQGAADGLPDGGLVIDMSTIAPTASVAIGERLRERGHAFLDAPVSGSRPKAVDGTLTIMAGGEAADFSRARPVLEAMGELVVHVGPQGHGSLVKLINNTLAAINAAALAEALTLAQTAGIDTGALREVVAASSGASTMLAIKAEPMIERDYEPLFKLEHMLKDVRHCVAEAHRLGAPAKLAELAERLYAGADQRGLGGQDFAAVMEAVAAEDAASRT